MLNVTRLAANPHSTGGYWYRHFPPYDDGVQSSCRIEIRARDPNDPSWTRVPNPATGVHLLFEHTSLGYGLLCDGTVSVQQVPDDGAQPGTPADPDDTVTYCSCGDQTLSPCPPGTRADCSGGTIRCVPIGVVAPIAEVHKATKRKKVG